MEAEGDGAAVAEREAPVSDHEADRAALAGAGSSLEGQGGITVAEQAGWTELQLHGQFPLAGCGDVADWQEGERLGIQVERTRQAREATQASDLARAGIAAEEGQPWGTPTPRSPQRFRIFSSSEDEGLQR